MVIQEQTIERYLQCPLLVHSEPVNAEKCAYELSSWVLRKAFDGKFKGTHQEILSEIRGKVIELWKDSGETSDPGRLSRTTGFKLFNLILDYEVLHLEQPYNLILTGYTIQGKYALLRKRKGEEMVHVLILHTHSPAIRDKQALPPDVITMARLLHVRTNTKYSNAIALHYPVFRGEHWFNKDFNVSLSKQYLENAIKALTLNINYPIVGDHCSKCVSKPCLKVFKNG